MCRAVKCKVCNKTTWAGCGQHIDSVKAGVPASQWCDGRHTAAEKQKAAEASKAQGGGSWLGSLFGR